MTANLGFQFEKATNNTSIHKYEIEFVHFAQMKTSLIRARSEMLIRELGVSFFLFHSILLRKLLRIN